MEKSPVEIFIEEENSLRASGRTTRLVMALPIFKKYMIVVLNTQQGRWVHNMIRDLRGPEIANNAVFVTWDKVREQVRGFSGPVYVDHSVLNEMGMNYIKGVNLNNPDM